MVVGISTSILKWMQPNNCQLFNFPRKKFEESSFTTKWHWWAISSSLTLSIVDAHRHRLSFFRKTNFICAPNRKKTVSLCSNKLWSSLLDGWRSMTMSTIIIRFYCLIVVELFERFFIAFPCYFFEHLQLICSFAYERFHRRVIRKIIFNFLLFCEHRKGKVVFKWNHRTQSDLVCERQLLNQSHAIIIV